MDRPFVTRKVLANLLKVTGAVCVFVFLQPWYESKYLGDGDRQLTNGRLGLPTSPWLTYKSDSKGGENADSGLEFIGFLLKSTFCAGRFPAADPERSAARSWCAFGVHAATR